jgi:nucleotide-binding universal stress UspA family protein
MAVEFLIAKLRGRPMRLRRILHPTDYSAKAQPALREALGLASRHRAQLVLLHVLESTGLGRQTGDSEGDHGAYQQLVTEHLTEVDAIDDSFCFDYVRSDADPVAAILGRQVEKRCDLIVLSLDDESGLRQWFTRRVAEDVVRGASCPVLVVKQSSEQT